MKRVIGKKTKKRFSLGAAALIGRGAEGKVFRCDAECVKIFDSPLGPGEAARMAALIALARKLDGYAWPTEVVADIASDECVGIAMRFVKGESLEAILECRETSSIPLETKVRLAFGIAGAVAAAHAHRGPTIVLGDVIKAGNLIIDGEVATFVDTASVSLFGYRDERGEVREAIAQLTTPGYVPKEVLENPGALPSEAVDRYALAIILFELLFGRSPHDVKSGPASVGLGPDDAVRQGIYPRWVQHPEFDPPTYDEVELPAEVDQLFRAAFLMSIRPSALDWCRALEAWLVAISPPPPRAAVPATAEGAAVRPAPATRPGLGRIRRDCRPRVRGEFRVVGLHGRDSRDSARNQRHSSRAEQARRPPNLSRISSDET